MCHSLSLSLSLSLSHFPLSFSVHLSHSCSLSLSPCMDINSAYKPLIKKDMNLRFQNHTQSNKSKVQGEVTKGQEKIIQESASTGSEYDVYVRNDMQALSKQASTTFQNTRRSQVMHPRNSMKKKQNSKDEAISPAQWLKCIVSQNTDRK